MESHVDLADQAQSSILNEQVEPPPTLLTPLTNLYRCNVFFPTEARADLRRNPPQLRYVDAALLADFWDEACIHYDELAAVPWDITNLIRPVDLPILAWGGGRDMFTPSTAEANVMRFGKQVRFRQFPDWAHDFGPDGAAGMDEVRAMIREFLNAPRDSN